MRGMRTARSIPPRTAVSDARCIGKGFTAEHDDVSMRDVVAAGARTQHASCAIFESKRVFTELCLKIGDVTNLHKLFSSTTAFDLVIFPLKENSVLRIISEFERICFTN